MELIKGKIFEMGAPNRAHQALTGNIYSAFLVYLKDKSCNVYIAPFDVRLPRKSSDDQDVFTVLQPDVCVICDHSKLDEKGCIGAPDIVVEILSPGNNTKELQNKFKIYEENDVKEYWIGFPQNETLLIYTLQNGKYLASRAMTYGDTATSIVLPGFSLDLTELFEAVKK